MSPFVRKRIFWVSMCMLGVGMSYLLYTIWAERRSSGGEQFQSGSHLGSINTENGNGARQYLPGGRTSQAPSGKYNGPPCVDEKDKRPGQPKPYCGNLPSLAAVNIREAKLEKVADGFERPWSFEFINDNELLLTEFSGKLKRVNVGTGKSIDISGLPDIVPGKGQAGLLDVVLHPKFQENKTVYFSYAILNSDSHYALAVAKAKLNDNQLTDIERIFLALPYGESDSNFGGRLMFDEKDFLFITTGDRSIRSNAQHPGMLTGKIIRLNADGGVPEDNPFVGQGEAFNPAIYALGVRNPQGLVLDKRTGNIYETEHGPMGGDEVNMIKPGKNYGWPIITYGLNYSYKLIGEGGEKEGFEQPLYYYLPSIGTSPIEIYRGEMFKEWDGDLLVGALKGAAISKLDLVHGRIQSEYKILDELNARIRDIKLASDSSIWVLLESGSIYRLSRETNPVQVEAEVGRRSGEYIYLSACSSCHSQNAPGVPQIMNKPDWTSRLKKERKALYKNSINGFNSMPAKGFCDDCTDDELIRTVDFIITQVQTK